jgi:Fur family transcriptional regulator, ferric uptake regulator
VVEFVDEVIEERQRAIAERNGFTIQEHALVIYGVCSNRACRREE